MQKTSISHIKHYALSLVIASGFSFSSLPALSSEGRLTVYCSVQNSTCEKVTKAFSEKYNIDTKYVRQSTGTILGKIKAEKSNPQADVWYGGTIEPHIQAAGENLLEKYRSPKQSEIQPQFEKLTNQWGDYTSVIYSMALAIGVNTTKLEQLKIDAPQCLADLIKPEYKNLIQYPDPRVSGTGYNFISTLIQLWGEEQAFEYLKKLHQNVFQYTKSGLATSHLATGEVAIDVSFIHSYAREKEKGAPVKTILACEGNGYTLGSVSIIKGARNLDAAKLFVDYALSAEAQEIHWREADSYQFPTNINARSAPQVAEFHNIKYIDFDFNRFGSNTESQRLIKKWSNTIKN